MTGFVFGVIGLIFGISMNILFPVALGCGLVAFILGIVGWRKASREPMAGRRTMAIWATVLGVLAFAAGCYGATVVTKAVNDLNRSAQCIGQAQTPEQMQACN